MDSLHIPYDTVEVAWQLGHNSLTFSQEIQKSSMILNMLYFKNNSAG